MAAVAQPCDDSIEALRAAREQGDPRAGPGESLGEGGADRPRAAGDDGHAALEREGAVVHGDRPLPDQDCADR